MQLACQSLKRIFFRTAAKNAQKPIALQLRERAQQNLNSLFPDESARIAHHKTVVRACYGLWRKRIGDSELRNDGDGLGKTFAAENFFCFRISGDGSNGVTIDKFLHPCKGGGVAAKNILPGEKEDACARVRAKHCARRVKRGKVVRLFVNVKNIGLNAFYDFGQSRIIMEVKVPVPMHWRDDHFITLGVPLFQKNASALILPKRRYDYRQVKIWLGPQ